MTRAAGSVSLDLPAVNDPDVLDVAEFFVMRRRRRSGVGRAAAFLLWNRIAGNWIIRVAEDNASALQFWTGVAREFSDAAMTVSTAVVKGRPWRILRVTTNGFTKAP